MALPPAKGPDKPTHLLTAEDLGEIAASVRGTGGDREQARAMVVAQLRAKLNARPSDIEAEVLGKCRSAAAGGATSCLTAYTVSLPFLDYEAENLNAFEGVDLESVAGVLPPEHWLCFELGVLKACLPSDKLRQLCFKVECSMRADCLKFCFFWTFKKETLAAQKRARESA
jgi:hypothetical protein